MFRVLWRFAAGTWLAYELARGTKELPSLDRIAVTSLLVYHSKVLTL